MAQRRERGTEFGEQFSRTAQNVLPAMLDEGREARKLIGPWSGLWLRIALDRPRGAIASVPVPVEVRSRLGARQVYVCNVHP
jgi:hypothetical protein